METVNKYKKFRTLASEYYIYLMFVVLPLVFIDHYFNISTEKWVFFTAATILYIFVILTLLLVDSDPASSKWFDNMGVIEWCFVAFLLANGISLVLSVDITESFLGLSSRHHGFANYALYFTVFFILRKQSIETNKFMRIFAFIGGFEGLFSTLQFLTIDPIGMYNGTKWESIMSFISTIGNANFFSSFLSLTTPLTIYLFIREKKPGMQMAYAVCMVLEFMGGLSCGADSFYLGIAAGLFIMLVGGGLTLRDYRRLPLALMFVAAGDFVLALVSNYLRDNRIVFSASLKYTSLGPTIVRALEGITKALADYTFLITFFVVMLVLYIVLLIVEKNIAKKRDTETTLDEVTPLPVGSKKGFRTFSNVVLVLSLVAIVCATIYIVVDYPFDDDFGTNRGFVWKLALDDFKGMSWFRKIFGYGQESLIIVFVNKYHDYMIESKRVIYDNVHCEPFQYLMTLGILGLGTYIALIGSTLSALIRKIRKDPEVNVFLIPIFSYFMQSFVNIAQTASTSLFFITIALAVNYLRRSANQS